jgi:hypothetical protein
MQPSVGSGEIAAKLDVERKQHAVRSEMRRSAPGSSARARESRASYQVSFSESGPRLKLPPMPRRSGSG